MDSKALIAMAVIGLLAGFLASFLVGSPSFGLVGYLISGVLGAFVGGMVLSAAGISLGIKNAFVSQVLTATIGAIIVIIIARIIA